MGKQREMSESTGKFIKIILYLTLILVIFTVIVGIWILASRPSPAGPVPNATATGVPTVVVKPGDRLLPDQDLMDGSTYMSMIRAVNVVLSDEAGKVWAQEHPDYRISRAEAGLIDIRGLSYRWSIILASSDSLLVADIENGRATAIQAQAMENLQVPPEGQPRVYDSNSVMALMAENQSISATANNMLFSLKYLDQDGGMYDIVYNDPASPVPYTTRMSAINGTVIESTYPGQSQGRTP